ncbi:MAG: hypothetical protein ACSHWQ_06105 [Spongiibacteraceae bacterium]
MNNAYTLEKYWQAAALLLMATLSGPSVANQCEDQSLFSEAVLSAAIEHIASTPSSESKATPVDRCWVNTRMPKMRFIELAAQQEDSEFSYHRLIRCVNAAGPKELPYIHCSSGQSRRLKYGDLLIASGDHGEAEGLRKTLDCFSAQLRTGKISTAKYNALLDTTLTIPLSADSAIHRIQALPGFQQYQIDAGNNDWRFAVELDREYGCFIEEIRR